jgi:hypothetical protein
MSGEPIRVRFLPALTASNGRLESQTGRGREVHAGSDLRQRRIVFASELIERPTELQRILIHELFHFVWLRAGNPARRSFERVLMREVRSRARGELGWSAEREKLSMRAADCRARTRRWREYACESFCDTAAWLFASRRHPEHTLSRRFCRRRREWFTQFLNNRHLSV